MYETYRVIRQFQWNGFIYGPEGKCKCPCDLNTCSHKNGTGCESCQLINCECSCTVNEYNFAGSIWVVEAGHPRKDLMIGQRFVVGDASISPIDELLNEEKYSRLVKHPTEIFEQTSVVKQNLKSRKKTPVG